MLKKLALTTTILFSIAACSSTTPSSVSTTQAQVLTDTSAALTTLSANLATIVATNPTLIPAATMATIQADIAAGQSAITQISAATDATTAASTLQIVETDLNTVLNTLAAIPLIPAPFSTVIEAAALIAPEIEAFVASVSATPVAVSAVAPVKGAMTLAQARAVLGASVVQ